MQWTVVIPAKALPAAKSRLVAPDRDALVRAIRADTVAAARSAEPVARVVLVVDRPDGTDADVVLVQDGPGGLNPALEQAEAYARTHWPEDGVAALLGDLPALRADDLAAVLTIAGWLERGFVPDADGTGTTLLTARPGTPLQPAFGTGSAARHRAIAAELAAPPGVRRDVDTAADLAAAVALGVGPATTAALTAGS